MHLRSLLGLVCCLFAFTFGARAEQGGACTSLTEFKVPNVEITKAAAIPAGTTEEKPWGQGRTAPLPGYCRVDGVMNRRSGVGGEEFGITFALAMPDTWNGDLLMQGGAGSNGIVMPPLGLNAAGDTPALIRGFAVLSNDTGHKSRYPGFDFSFEKDQQAYMDFAYLANAEVAVVAKQVIARYYGKAVAFSYFSGCSTGGREGMILSQRYPTVFNGIISGDPAMRTGLSNLAIGRWIPIVFNQIAPKDSSGKPIIEKAITENDRQLTKDALLKRCDAEDGIADGLISDPLACDFDLQVLACKDEKTDLCLSSEKAAAIKKAFGGPRTSGGTAVYAAFLYDTGITNDAPLRGLLSPGPGIFGPATTDMSMDVAKEALARIQPLVDSTSTNLTTFSANEGKIIFYYGDSDPWFSPLDTLGYYTEMAAANGAFDAVSKWSQFYFVPGMSHCGGGQTLAKRIARIEKHFAIEPPNIESMVRRGCIFSSTIPAHDHFPSPTATESEMIAPYAGASRNSRDWASAPSAIQISRAMTPATKQGALRVGVCFLRNVETWT
jgi:Tannase and feruloyl esterase